MSKFNRMKNEKKTKDVKRGKKHKTSMNAPFQNDAIEVSNQTECQNERKKKRRIVRETERKRQMAKADARTRALSIRVKEKEQN